MQREGIRLSEKYAHQWPTLLRSLGVPDTALRNRHGPCPVCGGKDRFRFDDKNGLGTYFCNHCGAGDGPKLAMLYSGKDFKELLTWLGEDTHEPAPARTLPPPVIEETSDAKRSRMNALWGKALPINAADPVGVYLASRIGHFPDRTGLRYQPRCPYPEGESWPAMLGIFVGPDGTPTGLHRTYLTPEGRKAPVVSAKLSLGPLRDGGSVRLAPQGETLGIAEGIETALAASVLFKVPCWAALNANRLAAWEPPEGIGKVIIFADNDDSFTGQTAAFDLAARIETMHLRVEIETPNETGNDWADVLMRKRS